MIPPIPTRITKYASFQVPGFCNICGIYRQGLDRDHIYPKWKCIRDGWTQAQIEDISNIQFICQNCHYDKNRIDLKGLSRPGYKRSIETREKMSISQKESYRLFPRKQSNSTIEKRRAKLIGQKRSEEHKNRMRLAAIGRKHTEETKNKIRKARLGAKASEKTKKKLSEIVRTRNIGRTFSEETRAKIGAAQRGKTVSAETRAKISAANKSRFSKLRQAS